MLPHLTREDWLAEVRSLIDARLTSFFADKRAAAASLTEEATELADAIEGLTMRGGKRLRPALLVAAFRATSDQIDLDDAVEVGAALELLQTYLLIHDDWMDHDEERRGGPSVHAALRDAHGRDAHLGASLAVLAGNLASAHAWDLLSGVAGPETRLRRVIRRFLTIHQEVVLGQQLDLVASPKISLMQQLKTGSYTVRGPLLLGAALADAPDEAARALEAYGMPLGEAFQMRDDLLGVFGDERTLGKPVGSDLRAGKRTALIAAAERCAAETEQRAIQAVLGRPEASDEAIGRALDALRSSGAAASVEADVARLLAEAKRALASAALRPEGVRMLEELADRLAIRDR